MKPKNIEKLLTLKEACKILSCHPNTLRKWDQKGILNAVRFGSRGDRRYRESDLNNMISGATNPAPNNIIVGATNPALKIYGVNQKSKYELPYFNSTVSAGFPSPADDVVDKKLDLNELVVKHPAATFFVRVDGDSMIDAGINSGDMLVVDRSLKPRNNTIIIALLNGEFTVKRLNYTRKYLSLIPENTRYTPIRVTEDMNFEVWGIVTHVLHTI